MAISFLDKLAVATTPPSFVSEGAFNYTSGDLTLAMPGSIQDQDLLIAIIATRNSPTPGNPTPVSDWGFASSIHADPGGASSSSVKAALHLYFHRYDGVTTPDNVFPDAGSFTMGKIVAFKDVTSIGTPSIWGTDTLRTSHTVSGVTTSGANKIVLATYALGNENLTPSAHAIANVTPVSTSHHENDIGGGANVGFTYGTLASAGASGDYTFTTAVSGRMSGIVLELT